MNSSGQKVSDPCTCLLGNIGNIVLRVNFSKVSCYVIFFIQSAVQNDVCLTECFVVNLY